MYFKKVKTKTKYMHLKIKLDRIATSLLWTLLSTLSPLHQIPNSDKSHNQSDQTILYLVGQ